MSLYIIILFLLSITAVSYVVFDTKYDYRYYLMLTILTLFICFRYGQNSDYFSYKQLYEFSSGLFLWDDYIYYMVNARGEYGFKSLYFLLNALKIKFEIYMLFLGLFQMFLINRFINKYCYSNKTMALLLLYPTVYLTYLFSGSRQGIVICLLIGVMYKLLDEHKFFKYYIMCFVCLSIHSSSIILFILPLIIKVSLNKILYLLMVAIIFSIISTSNIFLPLFYKISYIFGGTSYLVSLNISWTAILLRYFMFTAIVIMFKNINKDMLSINNHLDDKWLSKSYKIYISGIIIYTMTLTDSLIASRLSVLFTVIEISIISQLLFKVKKIKIICYSLVIFLCIIITVKNLDSYITQGDYIETIGFWNYPYVSIFNKDKIYEYQKDLTYGIND